MNDRTITFVVAGIGLFARRRKILNSFGYYCWRIGQFHLEILVRLEIKPYFGDMLNKDKDLDGVTVCVLISDHVCNNDVKIDLII